MTETLNPDLSGESLTDADVNAEFERIVVSELAEYAGKRTLLEVLAEDAIVAPNMSSRSSPIYTADQPDEP